MQQGAFSVLVEPVIESLQHLYLVNIAIGFDHGAQYNYAFHLLPHEVGRIRRINFFDCHRSREFSSLKARTLEFSEPKNPASACRR